MSTDFQELIFDLESDIDDNKIKAARTLAQTGDASHLPHLEKQFTSPNQTVRYFVKKAIDAIKLRSAGGAAVVPPPQAHTPPVEEFTRPEIPLSRPVQTPVHHDEVMGQPIKLDGIGLSATPANPPAAKMEISDSELLTKLSKLPEDKKIAELIRVFDEGDYDLLDNVVVAKIAEMAGAEKNIEIACWYLRIVGKNGGSSFLPQIARYLKSPNPKHISAALDALYYVNDKNLVNIIPQFIRHTDLEVQSSAIAALWASDHEKSKQIIEKMLNADEREYRLIAARTISKIPDDKSMELAMSIFYNEEDPEIFKLGVQSIQKKTNESNYYKLKEIIDSLPSQKANFIRQLIDKYEKAHQVADDEISDAGTEISIDPEAEKERERAEKEKMQKIAQGGRVAASKRGGQPQEVIDEKDLIIDVNNLTPVPTLLIEIGSKKEVERVRAVKMLVAHLKKGVNADLKEQITFALEIAQGDRSQRVRDVVSDASLK